MYAYLKGTITEVKPSYITLENQGVGYLLIVPNPYNFHLGEETKIFTHHYVREDIFNLYGFSSLESKSLFVRLISVSGIGPKSALSILAGNQIDEIILAIESGDAKYLTKYPGIGLKSAQQIILDLKGKLVDDPSELLPTQSSDVEDALIALGYSKIEIKKVLKKIDLDQPVEVLIKEALRRLLK